MQHSAFYRFLTYRHARHRIAKLDVDPLENPLRKIGMPDVRVGVPEIKVLVDEEYQYTNEIDPVSLGRRVSDVERIENLRRLKQICLRNDISLIVIHPSYRKSSRHECLLTRCCQEEDILMFEAYSSLHSPTGKKSEMFVDIWHPSAAGHTQLAIDLSAFIMDTILDE